MIAATGGYVTTTELNGASPVQATGPIDGRMKIIDPLACAGPSTRVSVLEWSDTELSIRVSGRIPTGALIHLRTANRIFVGEVRECTPLDGDQLIRVAVKEILLRGTHDLRKTVDFSAMEKRLHQRWASNLEVLVVDTTDPNQATAAGRIVDVSRTGVRVRIPSKVAPGAIVRLEVADCALFGQAIHCTGDSGSYEIGIEVVRVLIGKSDLARLVNAILADAMPDTPGVTVGQPAAVAAPGSEMGDC